MIHSLKVKFALQLWYMQRQSKPEFLKTELRSVALNHGLGEFVFELR